MNLYSAIRRVQVGGLAAKHMFSRMSDEQLEELVQKIAPDRRYIINEELAIRINSNPAVADRLWPLMASSEITFQHDMRAKDTQVFEEQYEESLQLEDEDKDSILNKGLAVWMFVNEELAGESYGLIVKDDVEEIEDTRPGREDNIYCYSTTVLPKFQGQGYGKVLKAYWLGYVTAKYPGRPIIGHSTDPAMVAINKLFGAQILNQHEKWYGTDRVAYFYEIKP